MYQRLRFGILNRAKARNSFNNGHVVCAWLRLVWNCICDKIKWIYITSLVSPLVSSREIVLQRFVSFSKVDSNTSRILFLYAPNSRVCKTPHNSCYCIVVHFKLQGDSAVEIGLRRLVECCERRTRGGIGFFLQMSGWEERHHRKKPDRSLRARLIHFSSWFYPSIPDSCASQIFKNSIGGRWSRGE